MSVASLLFGENEQDYILMSYIWRHETLGFPLPPRRHTALCGWSTSTLFPSGSLGFFLTHFIHCCPSSKGRSAPNKPMVTPCIMLTPFQLRGKGCLQSHVYVPRDAIFHLPAAPLAWCACRAGAGHGHQPVAHTLGLGTALGTGCPQL